MPRKPAYPVKKLLGLTEEQAEQIADYRFEARIASESDAIRKLIELGLEVVKQEKDGLLLNRAGCAGGSNS